jgi:hypothetical protein
MFMAKSVALIDFVGFQNTWLLAFSCLACNNDKVTIGLSA